MNFLVRNRQAKDLSSNSYPYDGSDGTQVCAGRLRPRGANRNQPTN